MKLNEILYEEQLDEFDLNKVRKAIGVALMGAAFAGAMVHPTTKEAEVEIIEVPQPKIVPHDKLSQIISKKYKVDPVMANQVVQVAQKHSHPDFPRTEDILSVIGIESGFNPMAVSKLKKDPAKGLMQVRPKVWKLSDASLKTVDDQIKHGAAILKQYYEKLKSKEAAIKAYNIGLTNLLKKKSLDAGDRYLAKFRRELETYE